MSDTLNFLQTIKQNKSLKTLHKYDKSDASRVNLSSPFSNQCKHTLNQIQQNLKHLAQQPIPNS